MKLFLLLLVAFSVALSVSAQSADSTPTIANNAAPSEFAQPIDPAADYASDDDDEPATDTRTLDDYIAELNNLTSSGGDTANISVSSMDTAGDYPGQYAVALRMGSSKQHVGTLRKQRMWNAMYNCLKELNGKVGHGSNYDGDCDPIWEGDRWKYICGTFCTIKNIVYIDKGYHNKGSMFVRMWWPHLKDAFRNPENGQALELMYRTVASMYKTMTEVSENCYTHDFEGSRRTTLCNVGKQVLVALPINRGKVQAVVKVDVMFNGKTEAGKFDCAKTVPRVLEDFKATRQAEIGQFNNWGEDKIVPLPMCAVDDCLDWYQPDKNGQWKENPKCKL